MDRKKSKGQKKSDLGITSRRAIEMAGQHATLLIEVEESPNVVAVLTDEYEGGRTAGAADRAVAKMQEIGAAVAEVCKSIQEEVHTALEGAAPNELTLEFGIKLTGESGVPMLTKVSAEGTLKVTAKWSLTPAAAAHT